MSQVNQYVHGMYARKKLRTLTSKVPDAAKLHMTSTANAATRKSVPLTMATTSLDIVVTTRKIIHDTAREGKIALIGLRGMKRGIYHHSAGEHRGNVTYQTGTRITVFARTTAKTRMKGFVHIEINELNL